MRRTTINSAPAIAILALAAADWAALWRGWKRVGMFTKPALVLALLAWFTLAGGWQGTRFWFGFGLIFALAGDVLMTLPGFLTAGLLAFLLMNVFYIAGLNPSPIPSGTTSLILAAGVWILAMASFRRLTAAMQAHLLSPLQRWPLMLYSLAISIMLLSALTTLARPDWPFWAALMAAVGGALLFVSDSTQAFDRFVRPLSQARLVVRVTYHLGQILLVAAVLLRYGRI